MANQVQLIIYEGYLVNNPEMRYTPKGQSVTNFRMGSNSSFNDAEGNQVKEVTWIKVTAWGKLGEIVNQWTEKGSQVMVFGKLRPGKNGSPEVYNLKDGTPAASYEITARDVRILKGKQGAPVENGVPDSDEELPF
jgi:single-strand DNA-binding protein